MMDADEERLAAARRLFQYTDVRFVSGFVTRESINTTLAENGFGGEIDLVSIDVDGNDS